MLCPSDPLVLICCACILQPLAMNRPSWKNRGPAYSEYGVSIKCTKSDHTSTVSKLL